MNSALFISAEAPYPLAGGGALRSASLLNFLARGYAVDMIAFREPRAADPREHSPPGLVRRLHVVELPPHARQALARAARNAGRLARGYAVDMIAFREPRAADPREHSPPGLVRRLHVVELPPHARHEIGRAHV